MEPVCYIWGADMVLFGNDVVTVFNRYFDDDTETEKWFPTLLTNVNLVITNGMNIEKSGLESADKVKLFLDEKASTIPFLSKRMWNALSNKTEGFTFQEGEDFFVKGDFINIQIPDEDFLEYMLNTYDDVFRVTTVDVFENVMPHMEVGGK